MKQLLILIAGIILGVFGTFIFASFLSIGMITNMTFNEKQEQNSFEYIEVKGKNGIVTLYTSMPKDSVKSLVGKPDKVRLQTYGNSTNETWGYKIKGGFITDLDIDFENGKLKGVRQN